MPNSTNQQENANQNHCNRTPVRMAVNNKCWKGCRKKGNSCTPLAETKIGVAAMETIWMFLKKLNIDWHSCCLVSESCLTILWPHELQATRPLYPWDFPGKNSGMDFHFFLQGIFPIQGSNLPLHLQVDSLPLRELASPRTTILPSSSTPRCLSGNTNTLIWKDSCTPMFKAALGIIYKVYCNRSNGNQQISG